MNLIRKYKISKITNQPLAGVEGEIISFIKEWLSDLDVVELNDYPDSIFWFKKNKFVLEQDSKSNYLYVRYRDFWDILQTKYSIKYTDVQSIIKYLVEEAFKERVKISRCLFSKVSFGIEETFKEQVKTSTPIMEHEVCLIEEDFKEQVKIPKHIITRKRKKVEDAFKEQVKKDI